MKMSQTFPQTSKTLGFPLDLTALLPKLEMFYGSLSLTSIKHSITGSGGTSDKSDNQLIMTGSGWINGR